jgi:hypothetical protein
VYDTGPFTLCGAPDAGGHSATMWVIDPEGATAMIATAEFA